MPTAASPPPAIRALHLITLSGFAVAQPLYDLLAKNPEFFIVRQSNLATVLFLILALSFLAPAVAVLVEALAWRLDRRAGQGVHLFWIAALTAAALLPPLNRLGPPAWASVGIALLAGAGFAFAYARAQAARWFLSFLSPAILVFPLAFLFFSPVLKTIATTGAIPDLPAPQLGGPVVMVVFDELPLVSLLDENHRIDAARFPNFARLAASATWHPNARSRSGSTAHSVTMILTGEYPDFYDLPLYSVRPKNLFTLMAGAGPVSAVESATRLCPPALCDRSARPLGNSGQRIKAMLDDLAVVYLHLVLPPQWRGWLPPIGNNWINFVLRGQESTSYDDRPLIFTRFIDNIPQGPPGFHFIHTFLPHLPWAYLPDGRTYALQPWKLPGLSLDPDAWDASPWPVAQGYRRHLWQTQLADRLLGKLLDRLDELGVFESSLIVVTADHGCNFVPGRARRAELKDRGSDIFAIPLLIKAPGQTAGDVDTAAIRTTDIVPEIAHLLGMSQAWNIPPPRRPRTPLPWPNPGWSGDQSLGEKIQLFGNGSPRIPPTGPRLELLGLDAEEIPRAPEDAFDIGLFDPGLFLRVDPDSSFLPLLVLGLVRARKGASPPTLQLAVSVNGKVRAVTETYLKEGQWLYFSALLSEDDLRAGENQVKAHVLAANP